MNDLQKTIKNEIRAAKRVLVTSHIRPDGDAIGSSLALALALVRLENRCKSCLQMACHPPSSTFLEAR